MKKTIQGVGKTFIFSFFHSFIFSIVLQVQHKPHTLREGRVNVEVTIHIECHPLADGQAKTIARGEVAHFTERLENFFALFFWNAAACVRHEELMLVRASLLVFQRDVSILRSVLSSILQQVQQDV